MSTLDEFKNQWKATESKSTHYDQASLLAITKGRTVRQVNRTIQYFWAFFTYQIIIYGLLSNVLIRYWDISEVKWACLLGLLLYLPFTFVLMRQFRRVALARPSRADTGFSLQASVQQQYNSLRSFYQFKQVYEYGLVPFSTALGVWLIFRVYVPGGLSEHLTGAATIYLFTLLTCWWAIRRENRKHFEQPLQNLKAIMDEFHQ